MWNPVRALSLARLDGEFLCPRWFSCFEFGFHEVRLPNPTQRGNKKSLADIGFSPPLCFVEMPLTALRVNGLTPSGSGRFTPLRSAYSCDFHSPAHASLHYAPPSESSGDRQGAMLRMSPQASAIGREASPGQRSGISREPDQFCSFR